MSRKTYIYGIIDSKDKKNIFNVRYVGKSIDIKNRFRQHLRNRKKQNLPIYFWMNKLFKNGSKPEMIILDECDENDWSIYEKMYIDLVRTIGKKLNLNVQDGGGIDVKNKKKIYQYNLDGFFIKKWNSVREASKSLKINESNISMCLNKKIRQSGNFFWSSEFLGDKILIKNKTNIKQIYQYNLDGKFIKKWNSISQASKTLKISKYSIIMSAKNDNTKGGNYLWSYTEIKERKKYVDYFDTIKVSVLQHDINGNFIKTWNSISEASQKLNIGIGNIYSCLCGKYKHAGNYIWKYK